MTGCSGGNFCQASAKTMAELWKGNTGCCSPPRETSSQEQVASSEANRPDIYEAQDFQLEGVKGRLGGSRARGEHRG